jgi:hypothetical protein
MAIIDKLPKVSEFIFPGEKKGNPLDHKVMQRLLERIGVENDERSRTASAQPSAIGVWSWATIRMSYWSCRSPTQSATR